MADPMSQVLGIFIAWRVQIFEALRQRRGIGDAERARRERNWPLAIDAYRAYLKRHPSDVSVRSRLAKTLFAAGEVELAEAALREALAIRPGRRALNRQLAEMLTTVRGADDIASGTARAMKTYARFRGSLKQDMPPASPSLTLNVFLDSRGQPPSILRGTLISLLESRYETWRAHIVCDDFQDHPIGSLGHDDDRVSFASSWAELPDDGGPWLLLTPGVHLEPHALAWLAATIEDARVSAVFSDDDVFFDHPVHGRTWEAPAFRSAADREDMRTTPRPPIMALFSKSPGDIVTESAVNSPSDVRRLLMKAFDEGVVVHVPLLLASRSEVTVGRAPEGSVLGQDSAHDRRDRILVAIPTRDEGAMLRNMVNSLLQKAKRKSDLRIVVMNNRSRSKDALNLLRQWSRNGKVDVLEVDEPFNWSRFNNLAVARRNEEIFVFANNDMEMLTEGWDEILRDSFALRGAGVVGARLLYPGGYVQHAGLSLGSFNGEPVHEGLGEQSDAAGPLDRWTRSRAAAAVSGAFLAVRRDLFNAIGGFDPLHHAVACNDIDFCLKAREAGERVLYRGDLVLTHFESRTRGQADSSEKLAWAKGEMASLALHWGPDALLDPSRNPHWTAHGVRLFNGFRSPSQKEVWDYIERGRSDAWRVNRLSRSETKARYGKAARA
ncbi:glycosyltransferase [Brevundimonas vesicularis]|uniref:Glycosyltransferase 2-like domain-containing protein n=2 Tax=Brevundimonas vesicularis TaxID=41276 RepID=A0A1Z3U812_BREVE|nr:glycosyltransferase [Brevundimonas vesicularis]ASE39405.1 hypothetical protein CEP68_07735 [Brevundimonas vesicularis]